MYERDLVPGKKKERKKVGTAVTAVTKNLYTRTLTQRSQRNLYMYELEATMYDMYKFQMYQVPYS